MVPGERIDRTAWHVGCIVACGTIGTALALSTVSVAFGTLSRSLDAPLDTVQWVGTGYLLGLAAVISTTGWLLRAVGARRLYLATLLAFAATSALCALATSIDQLIAFRVLQGLTGGLAMPVGQMVLISVTGPERMGRVMSVMGVPMVLGPLFGPVCGGFLIQTLGWQWLFLMNVPLSLGAFVLGLRWLPSLPRQVAGRFDKLGFALIVTGAPALVYGLGQAGRTGTLAASAVLVPLAIGAALLALFVWHALRSERPLLDVRLWQDGGFATCATIAFLISGALFGWLFVLPLYLQLARGNDALVTGLVLLPQGLATAFSMTISGRLTDRIGGGRVALAGISIVSLSTLAFVWVGPGTSYWTICGLLLIRGLGVGASVMPAQAAAYVTLTPQQVSDATPQLHMLQRIGGSIGTTAIAVILTARLPETGTLGPAFNGTFLWTAVLSAIALVPAVALARLDTERLGRRTIRPNLAEARMP